MQTPGYDQKQEGPVCIFYPIKAHLVRLLDGWLKRKICRSSGGEIINKNDEIAKTIFNMSTSAQIKNSSILGEEVLEELSTISHIHKKTVEGAGLLF